MLLRQVKYTFCSFSPHNDISITVISSQYLEVAEVKCGFILNSQDSRWRMRQRYRPCKSDHPQLAYYTSCVLQYAACHRTTFPALQISFVNSSIRHYSLCHNHLLGFL
ncbi:uncharacterized protein BJ212DRAFT_1376846 [Suillus subaureus]|uniref:Uncharacterized protein n=1 Tax=Suillus subaureus TaxID=48587 RepID=A0A9P7ALK7_9AGAM|nr:uncharacterized protein BJ212DRAFT_1417975 [Suillus subaureus]XP_041189713.1 uncharacterized protein BJ212DRAFT_1376846 [Suillus subaureus]KAG1791970.1 hypothetical protein BJ212DRAFT_1417975 [Suillus subaureus]KAG1810933.1 hypothetical protein BJ212DRAFT_1376846 [Suillus subaureus]